MDATQFSSIVLLATGVGLLLHYDAFARIFGAEMPLREFGVFSEKEDLVWERIVVVAGLALVMTGFLSLFGLS